MSTDAALPAAPDARPGDPSQNPRALRYLEAVVQLLDEGKVVSTVTLGEKLGVTRQSVWQYQQAHPELVAWVNSKLEAANIEYLGAVKRRLAQLAMRGSPEHAKLFLQAAGQLREKHEHTVKHSLLDLLAPVAKGDA